MVVGDDLGRMQQEAFDLSRLSLKVAMSWAHPGGVCTAEHVRCPGCRLLAPLGPGYCGQTWADCRLCGCGWVVSHDPEWCWQPGDAFGTPGLRSGT